MNLPDAHVAILQTFARMKELYAQPVFNEWVLVKLARESGAILAYDGPRADLYQANFKKDIAPLQAELDSRKMVAGDFAFVHGAEGIARRVAHLTRDQHFRRTAPDFALVTGDLKNAEPLAGIFKSYGLARIEQL